jgi:hypothetical protein
MRHVLYILFFTLLFSACNKEKRFSKRLIKGDVWSITDLTVSDEAYGIKGSWLVEDIDIYDSVPSIQWEENGQTTNFHWQFQNKGKTFEIVYKDPTCVNCSTPPEALDFQCYFLSGKYDVIVHKRDKMVFESNSTIGFKGEKVKIRVDRK